MNDFSHIAMGLRLYCGDNSLQSLPLELARAKSERAVVFCGKSVAANPQLLGTVQEALGARCAGVFDEVKAQSPVGVVRAGADFLRDSQADAIIAIGGGSAIVTARAASILAAEKSTLSDLCSYRDASGKFLSPRLSAPKLPQFLVPTSPTTAMVKAGSGVFDTATGKRFTMFDPKTRAQALFIHPAFAISAPKQLAFTATLNALSMAVEGIENVTSNPLTDGMLMHSLRLIAKNLPLLMKEDGDAEVRVQLMLASVLCGQGTDHASPGIGSAIGHSLGLAGGIDNGLADGIILPHTMRFNKIATQARVGRIAEALGHLSGIDAADAATEAVAELLMQCNCPKRLRDAGVPHESLKEVAALTMDDWFLYRNPRVVAGLEEVLSLLEAAW